CIFLLNTRDIIMRESSTTDKVGGVSIILEQELQYSLLFKKKSFQRSDSKFWMIIALIKILEDMIEDLQLHARKRRK
ncbi:hypothetical protein ACJX0J_024239, partial [Zea mays]